MLWPDAHGRRNRSLIVATDILQRDRDLYADIYNVWIRPSLSGDIGFVTGELSSWTNVGYLCMCGWVFI